MRASSLKVSVFLLAAVGFCGSALAGTSNPVVWLGQEVTASDGYFGSSVALSGTTALIGAPTYNNMQGAVYAFSESGGAWSQTTQLTAGDPAELTFGRSLALSGATSLIAASGYDAGGHSVGAVYVFKKSGATWTQVTKLTPNDNETDDNFGLSVALSGTTAFVGAPAASINGLQHQGAVYVFTESGATWTQTQKLTTTDVCDTFGNAGFGFSVAISGTTALVGAPCLSTVYVFNESGGTWTLAQKLRAVGSSSQWGGDFGGSLALSGTTALIGAPGAILGGYRSAYMFTESSGTWTQTDMLRASDGAAVDGFGGSVALADNTALVGAGGPASSGPGAVYVFTKSSASWLPAVKLTADDGWASDIGFGDSLALSGSNSLIGAWGYNNRQGAAYFEGGSDLGVTVNAPQQIDQGQQYTSQTIITNNFGEASPAVTATIAVPAAASFVSANSTQGSCSEGTGIVTCQLGVISGNAGTATANVKFKAIGNAGNTINNTASITNAAPPLSAAAVTVIQSPNSAPEASDATLTTDENKAASGTLTATDADGDPLTFSIVNDPKHGSVSLDDASTGTYTYSPDDGYSGGDSFTFKANDGQADSNVATISITVKGSGSGGSGGGGSSGGGGGSSPLGLGLLGMIGLGALLRKRASYSPL